MDKIYSFLAQVYMAGRIFAHTLRVAIFGYKKYIGNAEAICRKILNDCWTGKYLAGSAGHFKVFWLRDFAMCSESLIKHGYQDQAEKTLAYALRQFSIKNRVTTIILAGVPVDLPAFASDSLPFLVHAQHVFNNRKLIKKYRPFIEKEAKKYWDNIWDKKAGTVRTDRHFAAAKDMVKRQASCYDTCMVGMLSRELNALGYKNPVAADIKKVLLDRYWHKNYFLDDLSGEKYVSADAQIFPFWTGLIENNTMLAKVISTIRGKKMDFPFPIQTTDRRFPKKERWQSRLFVPNYQGTTFWTQLGPLWTEVVAKIDQKPAKKYAKQYKQVIEKYHSYLEVFNKNGQPYHSFFYVCDDGMIWAALYLSLSSKFL